MSLTKSDVLKLVRTPGGQGDGVEDGHRDGQTAKPRKYYNKYNKENKDNKHKAFSPSVESLIAKSQKKDLNPSEEIIKDFEKKKETEIVSHDDGWMALEEIKQASVQLYHNPKTRVNKERKIVKLQIESKVYGYIDYIATLTTNTSSLHRFNDKISDEHRILVLEEAVEWKKRIKSACPKSRAYLGKFRESSGETFEEGTKGNMPIEEATIAIVWYDTGSHNWQFRILFQNWKHTGIFESDQLTEKQKETNMVGKYMYYPEMKMTKLSVTERRRQGLLPKLKQENNTDAT